MNKIFFTLSVLTCISISAQKKESNILHSTNVTEIEKFLKEAHPNDSRRIILKQRIVSLKNDKWMDSRKSSYTATKLIAVNPTSFYTKKVSFSGNKPLASSNSNSGNEEEFQKLISETPKAHKEKTVKLLNNLFDNDISNDKAILLIKNTGDCNIIVRIKGNEYYDLAVPAHGENFMTVKKGNYQLSGSMCEATYYATKRIATNMLVTLTKNSASSFD